MEMAALEKSLHKARKELNEAIEQLAETAIKDSDTYNSAIKKLTQYKWSFTGKAASLMIELAIEIVKERALESSIEKPLI